MSNFMSRPRQTVAMRRCVGLQSTQAHIRRWITCWFLALGAIALWVDGSVAAGALDHDRALADLASADAAVRRDAVEWLGAQGKPGDADRVLEALHDDDAQVRAAAESAVWQLWSRSGDAEIDALLESGTRYMNDGRMAQAVDIFTQITVRKPDFAEGWNKRATAYYLIGDYDQSLQDCDEVMKRNPHHFGALSGYGLIYVKRGELEHALEYFEKALDINPNMRGVEETIELIRYKLGKEGKQRT
jgi:tetratricopeptide (TPR) repeat protein